MNPNGHFNELSKTLHQFQCDGFLCDTTLAVDGTEFRAHSVVLAAASSFFKSAYLEHNGANKCRSNYYVQLPGFECDTVEVALYFIYTGRLLLPDVYKQADRLTQLLTSLQRLGFELKSFDGCQLNFKNTDLNGDKKEPKKKKNAKNEENRLDHSYNAAAQKNGSGGGNGATAAGIPPRNVASRNEGSGEHLSSDDVTIESKREDTEDVDEKSAVEDGGDDLYFENSTTQRGREKRRIRTVGKRGANPSGADGVVSRSPGSGLLAAGSFDESGFVNGRSGGRPEKKRGSRNHLCSICGKYFTASHLIAHVAAHSGVKPFACPVCAKTFSYKKNLDRHAALHGAGARPYLCDVCGAGFAQKANLDAHMRSGAHGGADERSNARRARTSREPGAHVCTVCGHEFSSSLSLKLHVNRIHQAYLMAANGGTGADDDARPSSRLCDCCGRCFASESSLKAHRSRLRNRRPVKCAHCAKSFGCRALMTAHAVVHTNDRPYQCARCGKKFRFKGAMRIHERIHTGERPYRCQFCARRFYQSAHLTRHRRTHTGERPYACLLCQKSYKNRLDLRLHCLRIHQINIKMERGADANVFKASLEAFSFGLTSNAEHEQTSSLM